MGCEVCIGQDLDRAELCEVISETKPTARKPAKCCECRSVIPPGSQYEKFVGKYDGELTTYRTCLLCAEIRRVFTCGESWIWESLWDDMEELAFPELTTATECFRELSPAAKEFVLAKWRKWKGLP